MFVPQVATRPADNPVSLVARRLHLGGVARAAPKLPLPGKLVFPSMHQAGHFSMLGLGDVVMPGLLLCFVLRYDAYKKTQLLPGGCETGVPPPRHFSRISYFHCSLIGYFLGLLTATVSSEVFKAAQPALLYLVPFTLLPLLTMAYLKVPRQSLYALREHICSSLVKKKMPILGCRHDSVLYVRAICKRKIFHAMLHHFQNICAIELSFKIFLH